MEEATEWEDGVMPRGMSEKAKRIISATEAEFGEPFWDVINGFCNDGYARGTVSKIIGFDTAGPLKRLEVRFGVALSWPAHGQDVANKEPRGDYTKERTEKRLATLGWPKKEKAKKERAPRIPPRGMGWQAKK